MVGPPTLRLVADLRTCRSAGGAKQQLFVNLEYRSGGPKVKATLPAEG